MAGRHGGDQARLREQPLRLPKPAAASCRWRTAPVVAATMAGAVAHDGTDVARTVAFSSTDRVVAALIGGTRHLRVSRAHPRNGATHDAHHPESPSRRDLVGGRLARRFPAPGADWGLAPPAHHAWCRRGRPGGLRRAGGLVDTSRSQRHGPGAVGDGHRARGRLAGGCGAAVRVGDRRVAGRLRVVFELVRLGATGATVDGITLSSEYGIMAFAVGRLFHGLLTLLPMAVGVAFGCRWKRDDAPAWPRRAEHSSGGPGGPCAAASSSCRPRCCWCSPSRWCDRRRPIRSSGRTARGWPQRGTQPGFARGQPGGAA